MKWFKSELGRFPITSFIKTQVLMYFVRINSNNINPLIKESLNAKLGMICQTTLGKNLYFHNSKIYINSWNG
jgi:hypothetical protein